MARISAAGRCASSASSTRSFIRSRRRCGTPSSPCIAPGEWHAVLDRWYAEDLPGRYPAPATDLVECGTGGISA